MPTLSKAHAVFRSTQWSIVFRAGSDSSAESRAAMAALCENYWYPIYAFARSRGHGHHDAADLTQGLFAHLIEQNSFNRLDPAQGRFRAFLLASMKNYMSDDWRRRRSLKRGGSMNGIPVELAEFDKRYQQQLSHNCSADLLFERSWVEALLRRVLQILQRDYENAGKLKLFKLLSDYLVATTNKLPQAEIAARLGMSVPAVTMSLQRMRKRYVSILRQELAHTVLDPADVDDELKKLKATMEASAASLTPYLS